MGQELACDRLTQVRKGSLADDTDGVRKVEILTKAGEGLQAIAPFGTGGQSVCLAKWPPRLHLVTDVKEATLRALERLRG